MEIFWMIVGIIISIWVANGVLETDKRIKENKKMDPVMKFLLRCGLWILAIGGTLVFLFFKAILTAPSRKDK
jgi:hypothetical protein